MATLYVDQLLNRAGRIQPLKPIMLEQSFDLS
jgi:hypothetical protein